MLYQFGKIWRVVWTDGRDLPKIRIKVFGYSVGKWEDDYTFVVQTSGSMKEHGSIEPVVRIAAICGWRSDSTAWTMTIWS